MLKVSQRVNWWSWPLNPRNPIQEHMYLVKAYDLIKAQLNCHLFQEAFPVVLIRGALKKHVHVCLHHSICHALLEAFIHLLHCFFPKL